MNLSESFAEISRKCVMISAFLQVSGGINTIDNEEQLRTLITTLDLTEELMTMALSQLKVEAIIRYTQVRGLQSEVNLDDTRPFERDTATGQYYPR